MTPTGGPHQRSRFRRIACPSWARQPALVQERAGPVRLPGPGQWSTASLTVTRRFLRRSRSTTHRFSRNRLLQSGAVTTAALTARSGTVTGTALAGAATTVTEVVLALGVTDNATAEGTPAVRNIASTATRTELRRSFLARAQPGSPCPQQGPVMRWLRCSQERSTARSQRARKPRTVAGPVMRWLQSYRVRSMAPNQQARNPRTVAEPVMRWLQCCQVRLTARSQRARNRRTARTTARRPLTRSRRYYWARLTLTLPARILLRALGVIQERPRPLTSRLGCGMPRA